MGVVRLLHGQRPLWLVATIVSTVAFAVQAEPALAAAPSAPLNVTATPASSQAQVSWTAPTSDGGSPVTGYTLTPYLGSAAQPPVAVNNGSATSAVVTGLSNGSAYTFTVTALNASGPGPESSPSSAVTPWDTILDFSTPSIVDSGDGTPVELGVKFTSTLGGAITGIRFFKAPTNSGPHVISLWTASGQLLEQATSSNESASGWQTVTFPSSVAVTAGTTYVAGYYAPNGHYSATVGGLANPVVNGPLEAPADAQTGGNGVFAYAGASTFPTNSYSSNSYSVDVLFAPPGSASSPGQPSGVSVSPGDGSATVTWGPPSDGGSPITSFTITPYSGSTPLTPTTVSNSLSSPTASALVGGLTDGTSYTFTVSARNAVGSGPPSSPAGPVTPLKGVPPGAPSNVVASPASSQAQVSWSAPTSNGGSQITGYTITPFLGPTAQAPVQVPSGSATSAVLTGLSNGCAYTFTVSATNALGVGPASSASSAVTPWDTIFDFSGSPQLLDSGDASAVELGVKFTASQTGAITGIRFFKAADNSGTHIGSLWTASGQLLEQATFTGESGSGWQTVTFPSSVAVTAGTTYVAGYFAPNGHYSSTPGGLNGAVLNQPLQALANGTSGADGVFAYSSASTFPANGYNSTNYWVDVLFAPSSAASAPGQPTGITASAGGASANVSWTAPSDGGSPITSYTVTPYIGSTAQTPTTLTGSPSTNSATVKGLTNGTAYTFTVTAGNAAGSGPASDQSNAVTPFVVNPPGVPGNVAASPASSEAQVSWSAPSSDGGVPITGYTITPYIGATAQAAVQVSSGTATGAVITGLTNGTAYTFTVTANNSGGAGPASAPSDAVTPADTIFDFAGTPQTVDSGDPSSVELGVKFTASTAGFVTGIRYYKSSANTGTHSGSLWSASGQLLASATFTGETGSGWQTVSFATPVAVSAGTTYVASYFDPNGHYSVNPGGLANAIVNGPLQALNSAGSQGDGVYAYSSSSTFPANSYNSTNYWVDVLFTTASSIPPPGQPTGVTATAEPQAATVSWSPPAGGGPVGSYIVTPYAGSSAQPPVQVTAPATSTTVAGLIPDTSYTFTVQASSPAGSGPVSTASNAVTPTAATAPSPPQNVSATPATGQAQVTWAAPASNGGSAISGYTVTPFVGSAAQAPVTVSNPSATSALVSGLDDGTAYTFTVTANNSAGTSAPSAASAAATPENTIFDFSGTPSTIDGGDAGAVSLGVQFTADTGGFIDGIRFYKAAANTGTHIGSLWSTSGQLLASATFANETSSGWQSVVFSTPVAVTAGTTYVASYLAPNGHYSSTPFGLNAAVDNPPLHALAAGAATGGNGVYAYGNTPTFPTNSYQATNYWIDVLFSPASANSAPGQPTNVSASPGFQGASVSWTAPWNGGATITSYTVTPYIGTTAQTPTTVSGSPAPTSATIGGLTNGTVYTFRVAATNANGTGQASASSSSVTPNPQPAGQWSSLMNWPLVAVHAALLDTGNVLTWDAWQQPQPTQEYNPATQAFTNPISSPDGIFCSATVQMPDGKILVVGGYGELSTGNLGIVDTSIYDPAAHTWTRMANMHYPRWYEGLTELADGRYVAISGKSNDFTTWADTPEVYDPSANTWTQLSNVSTSQIHELEYPNTYLLPNGNVFVLGEQEDLSYELSVANQTWDQVGGKSGVINGGSVMYRPGKILYAGGAASFGAPSQAQANAATIDLTSSSPQWQATAPMNYPRAFNTLQMLANGTVLAVGGESQTAQANGQGEVSGGVLASEIWDPSTGQWTTAASMAATRGYHTSTLLLPDGKVLVAGSGHAAPGEPGQYSAQVYSPPYLFKGPRPTITSAPSSATYGSSITVSTPDAASIQSVNLVDLGTSTHQMDFSQHFVPLSFSAGPGSLTVQMPADGNSAPPANYMLFILNSDGVPSIAPIINLGGAATGSTPAVASVQAHALSPTSSSVSWAPSATASSTSTYTVTASSGATPLIVKRVSGDPAPTSTTFTGLTTGRSYTFKVKALNAAGAGRWSRSSNRVTLHAAVRPSFVQRASAYADTSIGLRVALAPVTTGNRLVVQTSVWGNGARTASVNDSAGDHFTELFSGRAADGTEMGVWTTPVTARTGTRPTITVTPSWTADVGVVAVEYAGLSTAPGAGAVDQIVARGGVTGSRGLVGSGATAPTTGANELAVGLYADSGFGDTVTPGRGYRGRFALARTRTMMEQLVEDRVVGSGARPMATVHTGARTPWMLATIVFRAAGAPVARAPKRVAGARQRARHLKALLKAFAAARDRAASHPVPPLSQRPRTHALAGQIFTFTGPQGDFTALYYCVVSVANQ